MPKPGIVSLAVLHDLLVEACETERRSLKGIRRATLTYWPDTLPEWLSYPDPATRTSLALATAEQLSRYDELVGLVARLEESQRRLVWATAHSAAFRSRPRWAKLGRMFHCDRRKVKRLYLKALLEAVRLWNG